MEQFAEAATGRARQVSLRAVSRVTTGAHTGGRKKKLMMRFVDGGLMALAGLFLVGFGLADGALVAAALGLAALGYAAYIALGSGSYAMPTILYVIAVLGIIAGGVALFGGGS